MQIRKAKVSDCPQMLKYVKALARLEGAEGRVTNSVANLKKYGFGPKAVFRALMIEATVKGKKIPAGFALYYNRYSTWVGKSIEIEDVYIEPVYRGKGMGTQIFAYLAKVALATDCSRVEWQVYHRELPGAVKLYKSLGAHFEKGIWRCQLNDSKSIGALAQKLNS